MAAAPEVLLSMLTEWACTYSASVTSTAPSPLFSSFRAKIFSSQYRNTFRSNTVSPHFPGKALIFNIKKDPGTAPTSRLPGVPPSGSRLSGVMSQGFKRRLVTGPVSNRSLQKGSRSQ